MTKINKLVINGFKSFANRTELIFGDDFNCVLGPNGSGKSNILDSIVFVLGKSSAKGMRAEKSANLIYNGGKKKKPASKCDVSIYFDNSAGLFPTDEKEVVVTRIVKKNGQSTYKINDETRTRQQILDLLSIAKINPDGYNIILQGDIVKLVEMSPVERRKIIEEIAGISSYEEKKQKSLRELERVEEKLNEADIVLKERSAYLKELKKDRDQALNYKELNDKIKSNKASFLKHQMEKKESEKEEFDSKIKKHTEVLDKNKGKVADFRKEIQERKDKIKAIADEIEKKGEKDQVEMQKSVESLRVEVATHKNRISTCQNEISRIEQRKEQLNKNLEDVSGKIGGMKTNEKELADTVKYKEGQKKELEQKIKEFKKKYKLGEESEKIEKQIEELDQSIEEKQKAVTETREKQQELLREKDKIEFQIQTMDDKIRKVMSVEKEHEAEIKALKQKKDEFKKATVELNQILNNDSKIAATMSKTRQGLYELRERLSKLEAKNLQMKEAASGNIAVQKILDNKDKLGGIYGTVADLGKVSSKYSLSLEIAAGPRINGIVVEDDATAARCIKFLKTNKYGSATFLPLNKIKSSESSEERALLKKPGVIGKATELIKFDPKFKNIFSYVFGNTLVVDSIETARKIGIGKVRMITLTGDLTELSGAMIGGYRQRKKGVGFKDEDLTKDIERLSAHVEQDEMDLSKLQKQKEENEGRVEKLRELKANLEGEIIKTERSLHLDTEDLDASKDYKKELKERLKEVDKEYDGIVSGISKANRVLTDLKIKKQQLRTEVSELKNPTKLAELNAYEQARHKLTEELVGLHAELKNQRMQMEEILGRDKDNISRILKDMDKERVIFNDEIKALKERIRSQEKDLKEKEALQAKMYANFKKLYEQRNKMSEEISKFEQKIFGHDEEARKAEYKINALSLENAKVKAELAAFEAEYEQYEGIELNMKKPLDQLKKEISDFEKMRDKIGNVNMKALEIYETVEKEFESLNEKRSKLDEEKNQVLELIAEIDTKKKELFMKHFDQVNEHFVRIFNNLFTKGEASLVLENPENPFEEGMLIKVKLSGDKMMDIRSLSGGEKTMTALSFLFAIQEFEPASFYILDEVDAALDKANSTKLAKLVRKYCDHAQYLVISHNDNVISESDRLYGVSMNEHGISQVVSLKL